MAFFRNYLQKDFYYRNITEKKRLLREGKLPEGTTFEDDGVERYVIKDFKNDPALLDWMEQTRSKKFGERLREEKQREA